jgi:peptidoglycan hydrolase-like protein with peptidoglycan-binding domain
LNISGYSVSEDGPGSAGEETDYFGPQVKQALVSFQKENEIPTSGIVDTRTIALLNEFVKFLNNNDVDTAKEKSNSIDKYGSLEEGGYYDDVGIDSFFDKGSKDVTDYFSDAFGQYFDNQSILNNSLNLKGLDTKNLVPFKNIDIVGSRKTQKEFTIFDCFLDVRCANAPYEN